MPPHVRSASGSWQAPALPTEERGQRWRYTIAFQPAHPRRDDRLRPMPKVVFTPHLQRHVPSPACEVEGATVGAALDARFADHPALRGYVLDEQGELRKHVVVFVDGVRVQDRKRLSDAVRRESEIYVLQALSGG
jgi:hypothetical protein